MALSIAACAAPPPPAAHTIEPTNANSEATEAHWPDASAGAPIDRSKVIGTLRALHAAVEVWRVGHSDECPTLARLMTDGVLAASSSTVDDWGTAYKIVCDDDDTHVVSYGPDRREGTPDDIVYPVPSAPR